MRIPRPLFQAFGFVMLGLSSAVTVWWAVNDLGPWKFFARLLDDEFIVVAVLSWLVALIPTLVISLLLRRWTDLPPVNASFAQLGSLLGPEAKKMIGPSAEANAGPPAAPLGVRAAAFAIDRAIAMLALGLCATVLVMGIEVTRGVSRVPVIALGALVALTALAYAWARDAVQGQSVGRRLLRLQVVSAKSGAPVGAWLSLKRELMLHFGPTLLIELVLLMVRPDRRRLGDLWADTVVIRLGR